MATHVDYPHFPGYLFDCPACEAQCFCTPGNSECVFEGEHNGSAGGETVSKSVKWRGTQKNQWHYGMVLEEDHTRTVVEYSHSVPASNTRAGRIMTLDKGKIQVREI